MQHNVLKDRSPAVPATQGQQTVKSNIGVHTAVWGVAIVHCFLLGGRGRPIFRPSSCVGIAGDPSFELLFSKSVAGDPFLDLFSTDLRRAPEHRIFGPSVGEILAIRGSSLLGDVEIWQSWVGFATDAPPDLLVAVRLGPARPHEPRSAGLPGETADDLRAWMHGGGIGECEPKNEGAKLRFRKGVLQAAEQHFRKCYASALGEMRIHMRLIDPLALGNGALLSRS